MKERGLAWAVLGLVALFVICQIVEMPRARTFHGDESFYIQGAYRMLQSGDYITPRDEAGLPRFQKPVLTYWCVLGAMKAAGLGLFAARIPSLLMALATLLLVYGLARLLLRDQVAALMACAVQVSLSLVYSNAHEARTDTPLAFFVIAAIYFFARLIFEPGHERRDAMLAYAATAGAVLTKGLAGIGFILLPVAVFTAVYWKSIGKTRWRAVASPWGIAVLLLLAAPWYCVILIRHGGAFAGTFLSDQVGQRVRGGWWYPLKNLVSYPRLFFIACLPWSILVTVALATRAVSLRNALRERKAEWAFLLTWLFVTMLILMPVNITRGRYMLPVIPVFSLFAGLILARFSAPDARLRGIKWAVGLLAAGAMLLAVACVVKVVALVPLGLAGDYFHPVEVLALIGVSLATWGIMGKSVAKRCDRHSLRGACHTFSLSHFFAVTPFPIKPLAICCGAITIIGMLCVNSFFTRRAPTETVGDLARDALRSQSADTQIYTVGLSDSERVVILLSSGRPVAGWTEGDRKAQAEFLRGLALHPPALVFLDDRDYSALPPDLKSEYPLIASRSGIGELDFRAWIHSRRRTPRSLLQAGKVTIDLISHEP